MVIWVEMYSKTSKVCVFKQSGIEESWWEWRMAEIRQESIPFLLCLQSHSIAVPDPLWSSVSWLILLFHKGFSLSPFLSLWGVNCMWIFSCDLFISGWCAVCIKRWQCWSWNHLSLERKVESKPAACSSLTAALELSAISRQTGQSSWVGDKSTGPAFSLQ